MVPSHWAEGGADPHAYTFPQWELIGVLLLSMPISFHSHMGAHICEVCSQTELMLHRLTYTNMPYSYMTSIQICFTVILHEYKYALQLHVFYIMSEMYEIETSSKSNSMVALTLQ